MTIEEAVAKFLPEEGDYVPAIVAGKTVAFLRETDPELLANWLDERAEAFVNQYVTYRRRQDRAKALRRAEVAHFDVEYCVDDENTSRHVRDMTGVDHSYVADQYDVSGNRQKMLAAFHRAVAKKVGRRTTSQVLSEQQYDELLQGFVQKLSA